MRPESTLVPGRLGLVVDMPRGARRCVLLAVLISLLCVTASPAAPRDTKHLITVLRSPGAQGQLSPERASLALELAAEELKITDKLPRVVVVLGCKRSAEVVDLPTAPDGKGIGAVITERYQGHFIYYLWLVDEPTDQALAHGLVQILLTHSHRPLTGVAVAVSRITAKLHAQVSVKDLSGD